MKKIGVTENKGGSATKGTKACDRKLCKESKKTERAVKLTETWMSERWIKERKK